MAAWMEGQDIDSCNADGGDELCRDNTSYKEDHDQPDGIARRKIKVAGGFLNADSRTVSE